MFSAFKKAAPLMVAAALPLSAFAAPTVTFQGEVTDQTCSVNVNGQTNSVVLLPTVAMADFGATLADGQSAGQTPFTVSVTNCQAPTGSDLAINTTFLGYDVDATTGVMGNRDTSSDAAKGFGIQLMDASTSGNPVTLSGATSVPGLTLKVGETEASYDFGARYFIMDSTNATAGKITAVAEYTLSYL
ncbi:type 1 fimbrial protein [Pseudocitrobacter sp. RIT415]|uniref:fimbrial protein n=1 Tax=Pseudocitrobacter sp. RIT415 TaxID=2202163 RepID=UPI000D358BFD|nr:fimbrial protein [Pseudocitrobacter sp. RIT 415]RAU50189.1 type 1 fimbrial protein [Pseudocitrobacter sp. RIT 415]